LESFIAVAEDRHFACLQTDGGSERAQHISVCPPQPDRRCTKPAEKKGDGQPPRNDNLPDIDIVKMYPLAQKLAADLRELVLANCDDATLRKRGYR
jgi:hypothetical protein